MERFENILSVDKVYKLKMRLMFQRDEFDPYKLSLEEAEALARSFYPRLKSRQFNFKYYIEAEDSTDDNWKCFSDGWSEHLAWQNAVKRICKNL